MRLWFKNLRNLVKGNRKESSLVLGLVILVFGLFLYLIFPLILGFGINMNYKIRSGNFMFDNWRETPIAIDTKVYLFHLINPNEFMNGAIPRIREVGPYVYKQYRVRDVIEWSEDKQTVKYWETLRFEFDPSQSHGTLDDKITLINIPLLMVFSIVNLALERFPLNSVISPVVHNVANILLNTYSETFVETRTVGEIINGRRIRLLDTIDIVAKPLRTLGLPIPEYGISAYKLQNNSYGFLAIRNNSRFGPFEVYTGMGDSQEKFMKYSTYLDKKRLGVYRDFSCDALNGTDGTMFGPFIDTTKPIYIFNQHACRSLKLNYAGKTSVNGVSTIRYNFDENLFSGPKTNAQNWCFCPESVRNLDKCEGILDLSQCLSGIPFALTFPHFLNSPKFLSNNVIGLDPDREKHLGFFDLEPTLGITMKGSGRFQINLKLKPFTFVPGLNDFRPTLLPYLWIDEGAEVNGFLGYLLKAGSYAINGANYTFIATIFIGLFVIILSAFLQIKKRLDDNNNNEVLSKPMTGLLNNNYARNLSQLNANNLESDHWKSSQRRPENGLSEDISGREPPEEQVEITITQPFNNLLKELHKDLLNKHKRMNEMLDNDNKRSYPTREDNNENKRKILFLSSAHSSHSNESVSLPPVDDNQTTINIIQSKPIRVTSNN